MNSDNVNKDLKEAEVVKEIEKKSLKVINAIF